MHQVSMLKHKQKRITIIKLSSIDSKFKELQSPINFSPMRSDRWYLIAYCILEFMASIAGRLVNQETMIQISVEQRINLESANIQTSIVTWPMSTEHSSFPFSLFRVHYARQKLIQLVNWCKLMVHKNKWLNLAIECT